MCEYHLHKKTRRGITSGWFDDSLAADVEELQPEPGQDQHQQHGGEGERKPGSEVDHVPVLREKSTRRSTWLMSEVRVAIRDGGSSYIALHRLFALLHTAATLNFRVSVGMSISDDLGMKLGRDQ